MSSPPNSPSGPSRPRTERGSAILSVVLLAAVIAVVAAYLLSRSVQEERLATRSFYLNTAANLAEAGIEDAMWAANNRYFSSTYGWTAATDAADAQVRTTTGLPLAQGTGEIYIRVDSASSDTPEIRALGLVRLPGQPAILKQLYVKILRRSVWANAIVAKGAVVFNGNNVAIDAYDSAHGAWNAATNRLDQATVATNLATNGGIALNNADVFGSVATGGGTPAVGTNGSILGATSPSGLPNNIDPSRVRYDFSYNIPDATLPAGAPASLGTVSDNLTLPRAGDTPAASGRYVYSASAISLNNRTLTINGPVDLIVSGDVSIGGSTGSLVVNAGATPSLALYAAEDVSISGNGAVNSSGVPTRLTFYGTRTQADAAAEGRQSFDLRGNAAYAGLVYAPNADIALRGGGSSGSFSGAVIGGTVTFNGNYAFHYDIQLGNIPSERYFRPASWIELTAAPGSGAPLARDNRQPFNSVF